MISPLAIPEAASETVANSERWDVRLETANPGESLFVLLTDPGQAGELTMHGTLAKVRPLYAPFPT